VAAICNPKPRAPPAPAHQPVLSVFAAWLRLSALEGCPDVLPAVKDTDDPNLAAVDREGDGHAPPEADGPQPGAQILAQGAAMGEEIEADVASLA